MHKEQIEKAEEKERLRKEKEEKERKEVEESKLEETKTQEKSENHEEALKDDIDEKIGLLDNSPAIEVFFLASFALKYELNDIHIQKLILWNNIENCHGVWAKTYSHQ